MSSQAILYETTNEIEIHITGIDPLVMHSVGMKGAFGTPGLPVPDRDLARTSSGKDAYRFTPPRQALRYSWSPATGLSDPNSANPTVATNVPAEYEYVVTAFNGACSTKDTVRVTVNDRLVISNRWGHEVYRVSNYCNQWQGDVPANGMYFYQLWLEKGNRLYKGWIHVWR